MSKSSTTVRDVFELPEPGTDGTESWKTFQDRVTKEVKGIKTAALPNIAEKVAELFEIPIPDIFLSSWKKANSLQALLDESRKDPETVMDAELGEHTINSQHRPHIEVRIHNKAVKKMEFTLRLVFDLKGFVLKIQNGAIREMLTGQCEVRGKLEYQGLVIAEKKMAPITLPGSVSFDGTKSEPEQKTTEQKTSTTSTAAAPEVTGTVERVADAKIPEKIASDTQGTSGKVENVEERKPAEMVAAESQEFDDIDELTQPQMDEEIKERKPPEVVVAAPEETGARTEDVEEPKAAEVATQETSSTIEEVEERTSWEVGEPEEDAGAQQEAKTNGEAANKEPETARVARM